MIEPVWAFGVSVKETILKALCDAKFVFYLTGSRYIEMVPDKRLNPDWDFFSEDNLECRDFLENLGFKVIFDADVDVDGHDKEYKDRHDVDYSDCCDVERIYRHSCGIDIQLVIDPERKRLIQKALVASEKFRLANKAEKKCLWDLAYKVSYAFCPEKSEN